MLRKRISIEKIAGELCTSGDLQHDTPRQPCLDKILFENFEIKKKEIQASHRNGILSSVSNIYIFKIKITIINISKITIAVILQIHFIKEINKYDKIQLLSIMVHFCRSRCNRRCIDVCSPFFILK